MIDQERMKEIDLEDYIFIIYYIIITLSIYANKIEREYLITKDIEFREKYRHLLYIIFGTANVIYLYYAIFSYQEVKNNNNSKDKYLFELSFFASFLILISGIIYLYIIYQDKEINVELAFN